MPFIVGDLLSVGRNLVRCSVGAPKAGKTTLCADARLVRGEWRSKCAFLGRGCDRRIGRGARSRSKKSAMSLRESLRVKLGAHVPQRSDSTSTPWQPTVPEHEQSAGNGSSARHSGRHRSAYGSAPVLDDRRYASRKAGSHPRRQRLPRLRDGGGRAFAGIIGRWHGRRGAFTWHAGTPCAQGWQRDERYGIRRGSAREPSASSGRRGHRDHRSSPRRKASGARMVYSVRTGTARPIDPDCPGPCPGRRRPGARVTIGVHTKAAEGGGANVTSNRRASISLGGAA